MGIRLDWEIQAEQSQVHNAGEDPKAARARRVARLRVLIVVVVLFAIAGAVAAAVALRLKEVDMQLEQLLRDTVDAEVASLRLGDYTLFASLQRSASSEWLIHQQQVFESYQQLKLESDIQLTGRVQDVAIEKTRGRVHVEEIIDGIPYTRIWFYFRYPDGSWYHVPPDYTFWGELRTYIGKGVNIRYQSVDQDLAVQIGLRYQEWLQFACGVLACGEQPSVTVDIMPIEGLVAGWSPQDNWVLQVPSPYMKRVRADLPFDVELQVELANLLAERLVNAALSSKPPIYPADAYYLRQGIISWLVGRFVRVDTNSFLVGSLAQNYHDSAVAALIMLMQPDSNMDILGIVTGVGSVDMANLDWRDLLTWRLVTEGDLIRRGDVNGFLSLYDTRDEQVRGLAYQRYDANIPLEAPVVVSALIERGADGSAIIRATLRAGLGENVRHEQVLFRLVDNVWRRAS